MDKFLKPEKFCTDVNAADASKQWLYWYRTFKNFLTAIDSLKPDKLNTLINFLDPSVYEYVSECDSYDKAIDALEKLYDKKKNEVYARHMLASRKQEVGESIDAFLLELKKLAKVCNFKAVSAEEHRDNYIRDAFINGIQSTYIRQRLLENVYLDLSAAYDQARALALAQQHSASYDKFETSCNSTVPKNEVPASEVDVVLCNSTKKPLINN